MAIKEFKNKSSVRKPLTRYVQGGETTVYAKRLGWWERDIDIPRDEVTDIVLTIDSGYHRRPDLVADRYYGNTELTWIVLQYNDVVDVQADFVSGTTITIPSSDRVYFDILVRTILPQNV